MNVPWFRPVAFTWCFAAFNEFIAGSRSHLGGYRACGDGVGVTWRHVSLRRATPVPGAARCDRPLRHFDSIGSPAQQPLSHWTRTIAVIAPRFTIQSVMSIIQSVDRATRAKDASHFSVRSPLRRHGWKEVHKKKAATQPRQGRDPSPPPLHPPSQALAIALLGQQEPKTPSKAKQRTRFFPSFFFPPPLLLFLCRRR